MPRYVYRGGRARSLSVKKTPNAEGEIDQTTCVDAASIDQRQTITAKKETPAIYPDFISSPGLSPLSLCFPVSVNMSTFARVSGDREVC